VDVGCKMSVDDYRLPRRVFNYNPRGKRDLGRLRMRWFEQFV
jgi:hypothetical protein